MGDALAPALGDWKSALFCDSWEVETRKIWTPGFEDDFQRQYGYDIRPYMPEIYSIGNEGPRYDYMKLVSEKVIENFYVPFTNLSNDLGAYSRAQCAGSPTDIILSYASVDLPESEAMLYNPNYSRIVASAAALAGKNIVSAETFTCLYGWPAEHIREENVMDLKQVADAMFANGVNHIIWHGMPFNPDDTDDNSFYASVHVGKEGSLAPHLESFNAYLTHASKWMQKGHSYAEGAIYLPLEDSWIAGEYPEELQLPWAWGAYELRYRYVPKEVKDYNPLWINSHFLAQGEVKDNQLVLGNHSFRFLYTDVNYLDIETLDIIYNLALQGLPVCLKNLPQQAGHKKSTHFQRTVHLLWSLPNVSGLLRNIYDKKPIISGVRVPDFWCRQTGDSLILFLSHPATYQIKYPVTYNFSETSIPVSMPFKINYRDAQVNLTLHFKPNEAKIVYLKPGFDPEIIDLEYNF